MTSPSSYEGRQKNIRSLKTPEIEVWENQYPDREYIVDLTTDEFTCICPKTGLPRWMAIDVIMNPRGGISTTVSAEYSRSKQ